MLGFSKFAGSMFTVEFPQKYLEINKLKCDFGKIRMNKRQIMLHKTPFPHAYQQWVFTTAEFILRPALWSLSEILSVFIPTTREQANTAKHYAKNLPLVPLYVSIFTCFMVPALVAFVLRCILHLFRNSYILSVNEYNGYANNAALQKRSFNVSTLNICLMPEFLSRFNNLSHTSQRAQQVGQRIVADQIHTQSAGSSNVTKQIGDIQTNFPETDFLCIQEAWDRDHSKRLIQNLHKVYPWILYDVGDASLFNNYFIFNSGLMFVSKFEIIHACFKTYSHSCKQCLFSGKGLLMVKVLLEKSNGENRVGYIYNTHLQAYQGETPIIQKQLDEVLLWTQEFRAITSAPGDIVNFDILCGDFNFDNMSPGDRCLSDHRLFSVYIDPARKSTGRDQDWTVVSQWRIQRRGLWVLQPSSFK
ncbi:sphingomyelin phosphodiesterase 3-like isoform X3 [Ostrea edulis]|uniref:sphingomyelin phosphodiesterase 3-like isoform X3 n=1 Tax=Ostrea edulis TaxID=37623 RepID=UPI0024AF3965|nr:sphingomyelin phosphodiesterase 3-like isoform X3 [Ostrea edulis]